MPGNLHLPRLGSRDVAEPVGRRKREPTRYAAADRKIERNGPPAETLRGPVACEAIDLADYAVPVRAVLEAEPATCRMAFGRLEHLTFCGARATVAAAGALTYCAACSSRRWFDLDTWKRSQDGMRGHNEGMP